MASRLKDRFISDIRPALMEELGMVNIMQVPRLDKVVVNIGLGEAIDNANAPEAAVRDIGVMTGQRAMVTKARKSISNFKIREGMRIGAAVTLRGDKMYNFVDRLFSIAIPRVRDFRGLSPRSFDGRGNYSVGFDEQLIFPEIDYGSIDKIRGFQVVFVTSAETDNDARALLGALGCPFKATN